MTRPLCIDLFCGLGGWTEGFLAEGYDVVGFDIEQHVYGEDRYPGMLAIQDVLTLHGSQFRNAAVIVASPPCQRYSYMAMPWTKAKALADWHRDPAHPERLDELNALFNACFRIQREACEAAGRHIPLVVENVKGAQPWVGRAPWHYGSFYLWGDIPALMPTTLRRITKVAGIAHIRDGHSHTRHLTNQAEHDATKNDGGSWFNVGSPGQKVTNRNPVHEVTRDGVKGFTPAGQPLGKNELGRRHGSKSKARKRASALIAKIPFPLSQHIARVYHPREAAVA